MSKIKFKQIEDIILDRQMNSFLEFNNFDAFPRPGRIKVIYFDKSTRKSYRWNAETNEYVLFFTDGIQGVQGYQGLQGLQGATGADGIQGKHGSRGVQGFQGRQGLQGLQGKQGIDGIQGFQGDKGSRGVQGFQGIPGLTGDDGKDGVQGFQGYKGADGTNGVQGFQGYKGDGADVNVVGKAISGTYERKYIDVSKSTSSGIQTFTVSHALKENKTVDTTYQTVTVTATGTTINIPIYEFDNAGHHKGTGTLSVGISLDTIDEKESVSNGTVGGTLMSSIGEQDVVYPSKDIEQNSKALYGWVEQYIDKNKSMKLTLDNLLSIYDEELSKLRVNVIDAFTRIFGELSKSGVSVTEYMQAAYDNYDILFTTSGLGFMGGFWSFYYDVYWSTVISGGNSSLVSALSNFESAIDNILDSIIQKFDIVEVREWGMSDKNYIYEALPLNTKLDIDPTTPDNYIHYDNFSLRRYKSQMVGIGDNGHPGNAETAHYDAIAFMHELVDNTKLSGICYDRHKPLCITAIRSVLLGYHTRYHGGRGDLSVVRFWRIEEVDSINDFGQEVATAEQVANQIAESTSGILATLQRHEKYFNANKPTMAWISNQEGEVTERDKSGTHVWNIEFDRIEELGIDPYSISIMAMKEYDSGVSLWKQVIPDVEFDDNKRVVKVHLSSPLDGESNVGYIKLQICGTLYENNIYK